MLVDVRHGLTGEVLMQLEANSDLSRWEVMTQVAVHRGLMTPYQVAVNPDLGSKQASPLHIIATRSAADGGEVRIIVHPLQYPTAAQYHRWVGGWGPRYLADKRERGPARVPRLLSEGKLRVPVDLSTWNHERTWLRHTP